MTLPHDTDTEAQVLGAIFNFPDLIIDVFQALPEIDSFYSKKHQLIYEAMLKLYKKSEKIDIITVANALGKEKLKAVGGRVYLVELTEKVVTSAFTNDHVRIVAKHASLRKQIQACKNAMSDAYQDDADPEDIANYLSSVVVSSHQSDRFPVYHVSDLAKTFEEDMLSGKKSVDKSSIIETRMPELNKLLGGGLYKSHLVVIGGSPSMGKTSLALDFVLHNGNMGKKSLIFTLDEPVNDVLVRVVQSNLALDREKILNCGPWSDNEKERIKKQSELLQKHSWSVVEASGMTAADIRASARSYKHKNGDLDLIIVDYIGQINPVSKGYQQTRERDVAETSNELKQMAKQFNCCVIAVSQVNRSSSFEHLHHIKERNKNNIPRPRMSQLKDSGAIEADANVILFPFVPSEFLRDKLGEDHQWTLQERGNQDGIVPAEIIIAKNKMGPKGKIECLFDQRSMRFFVPEKVSDKVGAKSIRSHQLNV